MPLAPWSKAQALDDKRWLYGYYFELDGTHYILTICGNTYEINPDTLCQFIGQFDMYKIRIFENDIIADGPDLYRVCYDDELASFIFIDGTGGRFSFDVIYQPYRIKVVGNMFDDSHMLKH